MLIWTCPTDRFWVCVYVVSAMKAPNSVAAITRRTAAVCRAIFAAAFNRPRPGAASRLRCRTAPAMSRPTEGSAAVSLRPPLPELHHAQMTVAERRVELLADLRRLQRRRRAALLAGLCERLP